MDRTYSLNEIFETFLNLLDILSDENVEQEKKEEPKFERPSSKLTTEQGLQLHKLTQEYIDTMVRPYAKNHMSEEAINDAYVGLYEFAAWILLK